MDDELRTELAEIKNMISEHNLILQKLSKQISADVAIQATQTERAVELNRLRQTASQAIKLRTHQKRNMSSYSRLIERLDPSVNGRHVEAFMRLEYGTLDHLAEDKFREEIQTVKKSREDYPDIDWEHSAKYLGI